jgi:hypothetical protein
VETSISPTRIAWFRPTAAAASDPADELAALAAALAPRYAVEVFDRTHAHDLVWMRARGLVGACVYELADTDAHAHIWPYLLRYPGIALLRDLSLEGARATALARHGRLDDYVAEFAFDQGRPPHLGYRDAPTPGGWPLLAAPLAASRLVVTRDQALAREVETRYPRAAVRCVPIGVSPDGLPPPPGQAGALRVGLVADRDDDARAALRDGVARAGLAVDAGGAADAARLVGASDIVGVLDWPARAEPPVAALLALAAGRPLVVLETTATAGWPVLDPQNWQPRGRRAKTTPIAISLDPRDEAHSLGLALRRLADDAALRSALAEAGRAWWAAHATPAHAADAWADALATCIATPDPELPAGWPSHLRPDAAAPARRAARQLGVELAVPGFDPTT